MRRHLLALGVGAYIMVVAYVADYFFQSIWIALAMFAATYLAMKIYKNRLEQQLKQNMELMTPEQRNEYFEALSEQGLADDKKDL